MYTAHTKCKLLSILKTNLIMETYCQPVHRYYIIVIIKTTSFHVSCVIGFGRPINLLFYTSIRLYKVLLFLFQEIAH